MAELPNDLGLNRSEKKWQTNKEIGNKQTKNPNNLTLLKACGSLASIILCNVMFEDPIRRQK